MNTGSGGYWRRLWAAVLGRDQPAVIEEDAAGHISGEQLVQCRAEIASLQMDLQERDREIQEMRSEYATLEAAKERAATGAGQDELERLFKRLAGPLANLTALSAMADAGQEVAAGDLISLIRSLEKELARCGLEPIGQVGQQTSFDLATHQRMSGGAVRAGTPVTVQLPGYRMGTKILAKVLVSATQEAPREESDNG
jgi:molecular chaperone GrpE (heat shock protein)